MNWKQRAIIAGLLVVHALVALAMPRVWRWHGDYGITIVLGLGIAQINLIALWGAFSQGAVVQRLPWALLLTVAQWYATVLGGLPSSERTLLGLVLLAGLMCAMLPMWLARSVQRWRLFAGDQDETAESNRFHLREALVGTGLLCIALACVRMVGVQSLNLRLETWVMVLLPMGVVANLVTALPTVWLTLRLHPLVAVLSLLFGLPLYAIVVGLLEGTIYGALTGFGAADLPLLFFLINAIEFWTLGASLLVLRCCGFRLGRDALHDRGIGVPTDES